MSVQKKDFNIIPFQSVVYLRVEITRSTMKQLLQRWENEDNLKRSTFTLSPSTQQNCTSYSVFLISWLRHVERWEREKCGKKCGIQTSPRTSFWKRLFRNRKTKDPPLVGEARCTVQHISPSSATIFISYCDDSEYDRWKS